MENTDAGDIFTDLVWEIDPITQQEHDLLEVQTRHSVRLHDLGIADRAYRSDDLTQEDRSVMNGLTKATINIITGEDENGYCRHTAQIRFITPSGNPKRPHTASVSMFHGYPENQGMVLEDGFEMVDVDAYVQLAQELSLARRGYLPNLNESLSTILR